jgi:hypothetical protein
METGNSQAGWETQQGEGRREGDKATCAMMNTGGRTQRDPRPVWEIG